MHPIFRSVTFLAIVSIFLTMSLIPRVATRSTERLATLGDEELKTGTGKDKFKNSGNDNNPVSGSGNDTVSVSASAPPANMTCGSTYSDCLGSIKAPPTPVEGTDVEQVFLDTLKCSAEYYHCRQNATESKIGNKVFTQVKLDWN